MNVSNEVRETYISWSASAKVERLARELNITNPDHIALWLDENMADSSIAWLACRIVEAHEEAIRALSKERDMAVEALEKINRIGSPRPDRTLGDCADDLQFIVDIARAALNPGE